MNLTEMITSQFFDTNRFDTRLSQLLNGRSNFKFTNVPGHETVTMCLEVNGDITKTCTFLIPPQSLRFSEPTRDRLTKTQGGQVVDAFGADNKGITIRGSFYQYYVGSVEDMSSYTNRPRGAQGLLESAKSFMVTSLGQMGKSTGQEAWDDLVGLLRYRENAAISGTNILSQALGGKLNLATTRVILFLWKQQEYYYVHLTDFDWDIDHQDPFSYSYEIRMQTLENYLKAGQVPRSKATLRESPFKIASIINDILNRVDDALGLVDSILLPSQEVITTLTTLRQTFIQPINNQLALYLAKKKAFIDTTIAPLAQQAVHYIEGVVTDITSGITIKPIYQQLREAYIQVQGPSSPVAPTETESAVLAAHEAMAVLAMLPLLMTDIEESLTSQSITEDDTANITINRGGGQILDQSVYLQGQNDSNTQLQIKPISKLLYVVKDTDNIENLANKFYNDPEQWTRIATFNNLTSSDLDNLVGKTLFIPYDFPFFERAITSLVYEDIKQLFGATDGKTFMKILLGTDFKLTPFSKNIIVDETGDLDTIKGVDCLKANLTDMLGVEKGTLNPYDAEYGMPQIIGQPATNVVLAFIQLEMARAILQDKRVQEVTSFKLKIDEDKVVCDATLRLQGIREVQQLSVVI